MEWKSNTAYPLLLHAAIHFIQQQRVHLPPDIFPWHSWIYIVSHCCGRIFQISVVNMIGLRGWIWVEFLYHLLHLPVFFVTTTVRMWCDVMWCDVWNEWIMHNEGFRCWMDDRSCTSFRVSHGVVFGMAWRGNQWLICFSRHWRENFCDSIIEFR